MYDAKGSYDIANSTGPGHMYSLSAITDNPAGTWLLYNVGSTSMQRHDVASTLRRRCINVMCPLEMIYPKQMHEVLLFVCFKTAYETNLSSKLPVADRTREIWGRKSVGDVLVPDFHRAHFCLALLILFALYSPAPLLMRLRLFARSCAICSHNYVGMLKSLREALRVSLYRFFWPLC